MTAKEISESLGGLLLTVGGAGLLYQLFKGTRERFEQCPPSEQRRRCLDLGHTWDERDGCVDAQTGAVVLISDCTPPVTLKPDLLPWAITAIIGFIFVSVE